MHINKKKKINIFVLSEKKGKFEYNKKFFQTFGIKNFNYLYLKKINFIFLKSCISLLYALIILKLNGLNKFVDTYSVNGIYCGDLIWDTYIRHDHSFKKTEINFKFLKILFISIYKIYYLEDLLKKQNIKIILTSSNNYASLSAIALRLGVKFKIKTFFQKFHKIVEIKKFDDIRKSPFQLSEKAIIKKYNKKNQNTFEKYFKNRMKAKSLPKKERRSMDVISAFSNKIESEKIFFKLINKDKKNFKNICVYAPHAFSDCNHVFGKLIYRDYYENFTETIDIINNDKNNLWIIKPHPSSHHFNEKGLVEDYLKKITSKNIVLCPSDISTHLILKISDKIVTSRGTIGLEAACIGKKAILTGSSPYSHLGISLNPKNKRLYRNMLLSTTKNKKLSYQQIKLAKKYLYYFGRDRLYDQLYFIETKWNEKNSFIKNLVKLQNKKIYEKKVGLYNKYIETII